MNQKQEPIAHDNAVARRAVVTGASRGIGHAVCATLLREGIDVVGISTTTTNPGADDLTTTAARNGTKFTPLACDLSNREMITDDLIPRLQSEGPADIFVHAAGLNRRGSVRSYPLSDWDEVLAVNLDAAFLLARHLGDSMAARGHGHIVFLASMLSFQGGVTVPAYAASKGAIAQLTKSFANELASLGVNVNAIAPGYITTDMNSAIVDDPMRYQQILERIPAGAWGTAQDIADACGFLVSDRARYIHGAVLPVDGGWLAR